MFEHTMESVPTNPQEDYSQSVGEEVSGIIRKGSRVNEIGDFHLDSLPKDALNALLAEAERRQAAKIKKMVREEMLNFINARKAGGDLSLEAPKPANEVSDEPIAKMIREEIDRFVNGGEKTN